MSTIIGPIWTKQAKLEGGLDPLGLDRASDRITSELLPGISVNVNLARYFSFFSWLFHTTQEKGKDNVLDEIVRAEKIYALSANLVHDGKRCANGIAGSELIGTQWDVKKQINLDRINWLSNGGVYLGLYKGPLFKLGLLDSDAKGKIIVTPIGQPLAQSFARSVENTVWAKSGRKKVVISRSELEEFGKKTCPCSLNQSPIERESLRNLFFETATPQGEKLSQSLTFILTLIDQCKSLGIDDLEQSFRLVIYYREIYGKKNHPIKFKVPSALEDIATQWRSFQAHDYFSFALESLLSIWLDCLQEEPSQKLTIEQFFIQIDSEQFVSTLNNLLGMKLSTNSLKNLNLEVISNALLKQSNTSEFTALGSQKFDNAIRLSHKLSEQRLTESIWKRYQESGQNAERLAESLVLLLVLYLRFYNQHLQLLAQPGWRRYKAVSSQSNLDLGLPRLYWIFPKEQFADYSVYKFLQKIMAHLVIKQALDIREERRRDLIWFSEAGLIGLSKLLPLTQAYQYHFSYDSYRYYRNASKLRNTMALLGDIDYIKYYNDRWELTKDGQNRLQKHIGRK